MLETTSRSSQKPTYKMLKSDKKQKYSPKSVINFQPDSLLTKIMNYLK